MMTGWEGMLEWEWRKVKRDGRARMPDAKRTVETGSVYSDCDNITLDSE